MMRLSSLRAAGVKLMKVCVKYPLVVMLKTCERKIVARKGSSFTV